MILHGSIDRFSVASVLQFLAQNAATGVLEVSNYEERGYIYLVKGRVEGISLPVTDDRLGVHLIRAGLLTEDQLARVLVECAAQSGNGKRNKALGARLVEKGFATEEQVREAMWRLTISRMYEITQWQSGVFSYDEPEEMPQFPIAIRGDVQELLLLTQVRIDEGAQNGRRAGTRSKDPARALTGAR